MKLQKKLSIVIPAYNEEKRIGRTLLQLIDHLKEQELEAEIIVVNDGSTDHTGILLGHFSKQITVITDKKNHGKGSAIRKGMLRAHGDLILFMDADMATPLYEIERIVKEAGDSSADVIIGSRNSKKSHIKRNFIRSISGGIFKKVSQLLVPLPVTDSQCGFKLFTKMAAKEIFERSKIDSWSFDAEVLYIATKLGYKVAEFPVDWADKSGSKVKLIKDSIRMIRDLYQIRYASMQQNYEINQNGTIYESATKEAKEL